MVALGCARFQLSRGSSRELWTARRSALLDGTPSLPSSDPLPLAVAVSEVIYLYIWQPHYFVPMRGSDRRHWDEDLQQAGASRWLTSWSLRCAARRSWHLG